MGRKKAEELGLIPPQNQAINGRRNGRTHARPRRAPPEGAGTQRKGIKELAKGTGTRYNLYAVRHSYITDALVKGIDVVTVSVLAGHRDTTMTVLQLPDGAATSTCRTRPGRPRPAAGEGEAVGSQK